MAAVESGLGRLTVDSFDESMHICTYMSILYVGECREHFINTYIKCIMYIPGHTHSSV